MHANEHTPVNDLYSYKDVLEGMEPGIVVWSEDLVCSLVNRRYFQITGSSEADLFVGQTWKNHMNLLIGQGHYEKHHVDNITRKVGGFEVFATERTTPNGHKIAMSVRPLKNGGHVVSVTDITLIRQHEEGVALALARAEQAEKDAQAALALQQSRQEEADKLAEFGDWLHSCKSLTELYEIVSQAMLNIYPGSAGQLYIYSNSRDVLDGMCSWGDTDISPNIQAQDCWSLRRGRVFEYASGMIQFDCNHVHPPKDASAKQYFCLPLIAHGDTVGLLHIDLTALNLDRENEAKNVNAFSLVFATRCAQQISLAVANAQLRDELHEQSTRDPLTGLFNRRYFLERCRSEITRAAQKKSEFGVAIFDADNFKMFNDRYGHDAGDTVLCHVADIAHRLFIDDDVIARIGGEEFAVLSLNKTREEFHACLEEFRLQVENMTVRHINKPLPAVTVSTGFAMYPDHGTHVSELIRQADKAMYHSKETGRNCINVSRDE